MQLIAWLKTALATFVQKGPTAMPPKAKQAARRANAKAAAKGAGKGHAPLDEAAERANFERLCPLQRGRIQELAARMAGSFDTTPDEMLPAAVRAGSNKTYN